MSSPLFESASCHQQEHMGSKRLLQQNPQVLVRGCWLCRLSYRLAVSGSGSGGGGSNSCSSSSKKQQLLLHRFNDILSRTAWVSQCQNGKTSLDLNEARDDGDGSGMSWTTCKQFAPHSSQKPHQHLITQFLQAGCFSNAQ